MNAVHWRLFPQGSPVQDANFRITMQVRDYECDMQGVVNNAVYLNYLEWARHEFLRSRGLDFADLTARGIIVVVIRAELDYLKSLRSGDHFTVSVSTDQPSKVRLAFTQEMHRVPGGEPILRARIVATTVNERGRPYFHEELRALL